MKYTVSILCHQNLNFTRRCVASVLNHSSDYELILTDNGCTDGTADFFREVASNRPWVRIVTNAQNLGFQLPNKMALEFSTGEFFVMLNNDTEVCAGWLDSLAAPFAKFPTAAISGPESGRSALHDNFHGYRHPQRFEYIEGSCIMVKTEIVKKDGLFDPNLKFAYSEDSSLCLRMRELGHTLHLVPIRIVHYGGRTSALVPNIRQIQEHNNAYNQKRWAYYLRHRSFDFPIVVRRRGAHGDCLLATPIIRALRQKHRGSKIYVETICTEIFARNPLVTEAAHKITAPANAMIVVLDGAYEANPAENFVKSYAKVAGVELDSDRTDFFPSQDDVDRATALLSEGQWIAIHPGPTWPAKMWPPEKWDRLISHLRFDGFKIVLLGTSGTPPITCNLDLRGRTTQHQLAAICRLSKLFIGVDSFPIHAAQSQGTPVVGLFGVTLPEPILTSSSPWIGVKSDPAHSCSGLRHRRAGSTDIRCDSNPMDTITVQAVLNTVNQFLHPQPA